MHSLTERVCITITKKTIDCNKLIILISWVLVRPFKNTLKRELGPETQMTEERSRRQKLVEKQLSDFLQCLDSWDWDTDRCNANHPVCHTSSRICFAPLFLFPRPEYLFVNIVTFSLVTSNCYVTAHQIFMTPCLLGAQNRQGLHQSMVTEVCNYHTKQCFHSDETRELRQRPRFLDHTTTCTTL